MIRSIVVGTMTTLAMIVVGANAMCACDRSSDADRSDAGVAPRATSPSRTGSCDRVSAMSTCSEYSGSYLSQNELMLTSSCSKLGGTFVYAPCPNTSVLGTCALSTGEQRKFYSGGGAAYDASRAKKECEGAYNGAWSDFR